MLFNEPVYYSRISKLLGWIVFKVKISCKMLSKLKKENKALKERIIALEKQLKKVKRPRPKPTTPTLKALENHFC